MLLTQRFKSLRTALWRMMKRNLPSRDLQRHPTVGLPAVSSTLDTLRSARSTPACPSPPVCSTSSKCAAAHKTASRLSPSTCLVSSPTFVVEQQPAFVRHCLLRLVFHPPWRLLLLLAQMLQLLLLLQARFWKLKGYTWREACTQRLPDHVFCNQFCTATALIIHQGHGGAWAPVAHLIPFFQREPNLPRQSRHVELRRVQGEPFRVPELLVDPTLHSQAISV